MKLTQKLNYLFMGLVFAVSSFVLIACGDSNNTTKMSQTEFKDYVVKRFESQNANISGIINNYAETKTDINNVQLLDNNDIGLDVNYHVNAQNINKAFGLTNLDDNINLTVSIVASPVNQKIENIDVAVIYNIVGVVLDGQPIISDTLSQQLQQLNTTYFISSEGDFGSVVYPEDQEVVNSEDIKSVTYTSESTIKNYKIMSINSDQNTKGSLLISLDEFASNNTSVSKKDPAHPLEASFGLDAKNVKLSGKNHDYRSLLFFFPEELTLNIEHYIVSETITSANGTESMSASINNIDYKLTNKLDSNKLSQITSKLSFNVDVDSTVIGSTNLKKMDYVSDINIKNINLYQFVQTVANLIKTGTPVNSASAELRQSVVSILAKGLEFKANNINVKLNNNGTIKGALTIVLPELKQGQDVNDANVLGLLVLNKGHFVWDLTISKSAITDLSSVTLDDINQTIPIIEQQLKNAELTALVSFDDKNIYVKGEIKDGNLILNGEQKGPVMSYGVLLSGLLH